MAVITTPVNNSIPGGCWRQTGENEGTAEDGRETSTYILKGGYDALKALKDTLWQGRAVVDGWTARSWDLQRGRGKRAPAGNNTLRGGSGILTITCAPAQAEAEPGEGETSGAMIPLKEVWSIKSVRNDVSVLAYCGVDTGTPQRVPIELWMKETDGRLAENFEYREADGGVRALDDGTVATYNLARKIAAGKEQVIRFYPQLTCRRTYSEPPDECLTNLACIDTPAFDTHTPEGKLKKPKSLTAEKIAQYSWLKVQDDEDEQSDGNWVRIESWIGVLTAQGGWDENFYGTTNRWPMPYNATTGGPGAAT